MPWITPSSAVGHGDAHADVIIHHPPSNDDDPGASPVHSTQGHALGRDVELSGQLVSSILHQNGPVRTRVLDGLVQQVRRAHPHNRGGLRPLPTAAPTLAGDVLLIGVQKRCDDDQSTDDDRSAHPITPFTTLSRCQSSTHGDTWERRAGLTALPCVSSVIRRTVSSG